MNTIDQLFEEKQATIIDRSTLERFAECPRKGVAIASGMVKDNSMDAEAGNAVHQIIADAVKDRNENGTTLRDLIDFMQDAAAKARPDLQPFVVAAMRRCYPIAAIICQNDNGTERHADDIMRYDGGDGDYSGQLAEDIMPEIDERGAIRLTSELDLMMATPSAEEVDVVDWKSGWKFWTATDVSESFQFQFQTWLVWMNYPEVKRVRVRVFMTRESAATSVVVFDEKRRADIHARMMAATNVYLANAHRIALDAEAWPMLDKCQLCPFSTTCVDTMLSGQNAETPEQMLLRYSTIQAAADKMKTRLTSIVRESGKDIQNGNLYFGVGKPKAVRAPICDLYELK